MEKFMLIFQGSLPSEVAPEESMEITGQWMAWVDKLAKAGKYVGGEPLLPGGKVISGNYKNVTDGPFAEGKEVIGGYFIVNAADYDEAVALCADYPDYDRGGTVIIRQVMKMEVHV
jgi:hypothetical protein